MLAAILLVAPGITKAVDFVRNATAGVALPKWVWNALAFVFGIGFALVTHYNAVPTVIAGRAVHLSRMTAEVVTGIALGGVAGGYHEAFDVIASKAHAVNPAGHRPKARHDGK